MDAVNTKPLFGFPPGTVKLDRQNSKAVWMPDKGVWAITWAFVIMASGEEAKAFQDQLDASHQATSES